MRKRNGILKNTPQTATKIHTTNNNTFKKIKQSHCVFLCICCFVFLLTFIISSNISYDRDSYPSINVLYIAPSYNNITKSFNVSKTCDSMYILFMIPIEHSNRNQWIADPLISDSFTQHGFGFNCNDDDKKKLNLHIRKQMHYRPTCMKYSANNNSFCNGGRLIYSDMKNMHGNTALLIYKNGLHSILSTYCNKFHDTDNICSFKLLTYDISIREERIKFIEKHIDCNNNKSQYNKTWVIKEGNKERGTGIHMYNNHQLIYQLLISNSSEQIKNCTATGTSNLLTNETFFKNEGFSYKKVKKTNSFIVNRKNLLVQEFLSNALLIDGHSFHMRTYILIASYSNPFIVLHWNKPIFFINPYKYNIKQQRINHKLILTNQGSNAEHGDWIWGYSQLQHYLDQTYGRQLFGGNYSMNKLKNDTKIMISHIFHANSYYNKLHHIGFNGSLNNIGQFAINYFDVYCMDTLINDKFELKLLELNYRCGHACRKAFIKKKQRKGGYDWQCDSYANEITAITSEILIKKSQNITIQKIDSARNFEIAYWSWRK